VGEREIAHTENHVSTSSPSTYFAACIFRTGESKRERRGKKKGEEKTKKKTGKVEARHAREGRERGVYLLFTLLNLPGKAQV